MIVADVVKSLDVLPATPERTMRFVDLEGADARKLKPLIERLFENDKPSEGPTRRWSRTRAASGSSSYPPRLNMSVSAFLQDYRASSGLVIEREIDP